MARGAGFSVRHFSARRVSSSVLVPVEPLTWGRLKALYRQAGTGGDRGVSHPPRPST